MSSINAQNVAREVLENLGKKKKIKLGKIALKNGYALNTADNPKNITETKSFQAIVSPVAKKMIKERDRVLKAMTEKDLDNVQHESLARTLDTLTKNIQLLTGGATENVAVQGVNINIRK